MFMTTTFRQSRLKLAVVFAFTAAAALLLAFFAFLSAYFPGLWAYLGISLFAPLALACAVAAVKNAIAFLHPAGLSADEAGIIFKTAQREQNYSWDAIEDIIVFSPTSRFRSPGLELKEASNGRRFHSFGRNWEKSAEEITEKLRAAKSQRATA